MEVLVSSQLLGLLYSVIIGAVFALLYDSFRILRYGEKSGAVGTATVDVIFWLICAVAAFAFMMKICDGVIRIYMFAGMLLGALLYRFTISRIITKAFFKIADFLRVAADKLRLKAYIPIGAAKNAAAPSVRRLARKRKLRNFKKGFHLYKKSSKIKSSEKRHDRVPREKTTNADKRRGRNENKSS